MTGSGEPKTFFFLYGVCPIYPKGSIRLFDLEGRGNDMVHRMSSCQQNHNLMSHHIVCQVLDLLDVLSYPCDKAVEGYEDAARTASTKGIASVNVELSID